MNLFKSTFDRGQSTETNPLQVDHLLLEHSAEGIIVVDTEGQFISKNRAFKTLFSTELDKWSCFQDFWACFTSNLSAKELLNISYENTPLIFNFKENLAQHPQTYSCKIVLLNPNQSQKLLGFFIQKNELDLEWLQTQRLTSIGKLASSIVHDLNNMLTPFTMLDTLIKSKIDTNADIDSLLDMLKENANRAAKLLKQILIYIRGQDILTKPTDIKRICLELEPFFETLFPKNIKVSLDIKDPIALVNGNSIQIQQMLLNICTNAKDAIGSESGNIHIKLETVQLTKNHHPESRGGDYLFISIKDTGHGISKSELAQIFNPFYSTKSKEEGTGIGLTTTLRIIKKHQGFLEIKSTPKKGSEFRVYLPALKPD